MTDLTLVWDADSADVPAGELGRRKATAMRLWDGLDRAAASRDEQVILESVSAILDVAERDREVAENSLTAFILWRAGMRS